MIGGAVQDKIVRAGRQASFQISFPSILFTQICQLFWQHFFAAELNGNNPFSSFFMVEWKSCS
jgi:hypothetical protein